VEGCMMAIATIVPKPKASDEVRESIVAILRATLDEAKRGELDCIVVIARSVDGEWFNRCSEVVGFSDAIGRLEITKQEWIKEFLDR